MSVEAIAVPNPSPKVNAGKTNRDNMEGDPDVKVKRKVPGEVPAMGRMTHEAAAFEKSLQKKPLAELRDLLERQGLNSTHLKLHFSQSKDNATM